MLIDELYFGDSVLDEKLSFESIIVILNILSIIGFHAFEEALAPCLHQLLRLNSNILTEQLIKTLIPLLINRDFI